MTTPLKISVCIPQYGRSRYLLKVLESIKEQTYPHVEAVVSDDCSKDDTARVIPEYLERSGLNHRFVRQEHNLGYDANLRAALAMGTGDYLLVLGNDDALAYPEAIADLVAEIERHDRPAIVLTNHREWSDLHNDKSPRRVQATSLLPGGPQTALKVYRSFSFVGGIVYKRDAFEAHNTDAFDKSIFVQVYLATRIIASGGSLLFWDRVMVARDVLVEGQATNSYKDVLRETKTPVRPHSQGLSSIAHVAAEAILPYLDPNQRNAALMRLYRPLLTYTYPYWLYAHRREGFWRAAVSMAWGCYPPILTKPVAPSANLSLKLMPYYLVSTAAGWLIPTAILGKLQEWGYKRSKRL